MTAFSLRVLLEGPDWAGQWTEITADALAELGCQVDIVYHNRKRGLLWPVALLNRLLPATRRWLCWEDLKRREVHAALATKPYDLLFSIQGKITASDIRAIRQRHPQLRVIYWHGDVYLPAAQAKLAELKPASLSGDLDRILVSYRDIQGRLQAQGYQGVEFFPFGVSLRYHAPPTLTAAEQARYSCQVAFVGTAYPERVLLLRYLNQHLAEPVQVWGRSWGGTGIQSRGRLSMSESLKVAAAAKISLNIHHHLSENGFNMKFYEIPAAGGFEICDWQEELTRHPLGEVIPAFRSREELLDHIQQYLADDGQRQQLAQRQQKIASSACLYTRQLSVLLQEAGLTQRQGQEGMPDET